VVQRRADRAGNCEPDDALGVYLLWVPPRGTTCTAYMPAQVGP
jgi:hypothetical protein